VRSRLRLSLALRASLLVLLLGILAAFLFRATALPLYVSLPLLAALGIGGSFLLADITVRPVRVLQRAARAIVSGGYQRHVIVHTGDELEDVADALNALGGTLREQSGAFRHEAERLNQVLETMVEGVMVVGPDNRVVMENRALRHVAARGPHADRGGAQPRVRGGRHARPDATAAGGHGGFAGPSRRAAPGRRRHAAGVQRQPDAAILGGERGGRGRLP
jgi:PAS domain-containing protein